MSALSVKPVDAGTGSAPAVEHSSRLMLFLIPLVGFLCARGLDLMLFLQQTRVFPGTSLGGELTAWDGGWYRRIVQTGYPATVIATTHTGRLAKSAYAFFPTYPYLVRWINAAIHLGYDTTAALLSLILGAAAAVGVAAVLRPYLGAATAATASLFWSFLPTAPLLMMAYTEALFTLELTVFFVLLRRRRYSAIAAVLPLAGLTRGTLLPLAAVLGTHMIVRLREETSARERWRAAVAPTGLTVLAVACSALWPAYVGLRAGRWNAYLTVQQAWARSRIVHPHWWQVIGYLNEPHLLFIRSWLVVGVAALALTLALLALRSPLSAELKVFGLAYLLFLFTLTLIWTPFFRYLLPVFTLPAMGAVAARSIWSKVVVLMVLAVLQYWWIRFFVADFPTAYASP